MTDAAVERFRAASGRETGVVGLVLAAALLVTGVLNGFPLWVLAGCVLVGLLMWAAFLRPAVRLDHGDLVLRSLLATTRLPLAAIEEVRVGHTLAVVADGRRFVSPAVGRPRKRLARGSAIGGLGGRPVAGLDHRAAARAAESAYPDYVEQRIRDAVVASLADEHPAGAPAPRVRRTPAYPEIAVLVVSLAALVVGLVLR